MRGHPAPQQRRVPRDATHAALVFYLRLTDYELLPVAFCLLPKKETYSNLISGYRGTLRGYLQPLGYKHPLHVRR